MAFMKLRDSKWIEFTTGLSGRKKKGGGSDSSSGSGSSSEDAVLLAEVTAFSGQYQEAAKMFARAGKIERAIGLFADLRQWEEAKLFAASASTSSSSTSGSSSSSSIDMKDLIRRQAEWAEEIQDWQSAADYYLAAGEPLRAIKIIAEYVGKGSTTSGGGGGSSSSSNNGKSWQNQVVEIARSVTKNDKEILSECGRLLATMSDAADDKSRQMAREVFLKLEDFTALMAMYINREKWADAVKLSEEHPGQFDASMFLPYANWLTSCDR